MTLDADTPADLLREWARGRTDLTAATELLIRSGFAQSWRPWVHEREYGGYWIDFATIPDLVGGMSGGQRRLLLLAASLGGDDVAVSLSDNVPGLDREATELLLAAIAAANGMDIPGRTIAIIDGEPTRMDTAPLYTWPES